MLATPVEAKSVRSQVERGPVKVTVEITPAQARLSDEPTLTLSISYPSGVTVRKPPFGQSLGDFVIRDFREPLPKAEGDRQAIQQIYRLEPMRTGKLTVYPIRVTFVDHRPGRDGKEHAVETEGLTVEVASIVGSQAPSLDKLRPAAGPVALPSAWLGPWGWGALGLVVALLGGLVVWGLRKRRRSTVVPELSPRDQAARELEQLLAQDLAARDVKRFYVELTGIVRRYIERTTGVRAPEQTTEEFLVEIRRRGTFADEEGRRLEHFLESADLVKFAAHEPGADDIRESVKRARDFLGLGVEEVAA